MNEIYYEWAYLGGLCLSLWIGILLLIEDRVEDKEFKVRHCLFGILLGVLWPVTIIIVTIVQFYKRFISPYITIKFKQLK